MSLSGEFHSFIIRSNQPFVNIIKETLIAWKCQNFVFCYAFWTILRIFFWQPRNYLRYFRSKIRKTDFYIRQKRKYSRHSLWLRLQTKGARNTRNKKCTKAESLLLAAFFFAGGKRKERSSGCVLRVCAKKEQIASQVRRMGYFLPPAKRGLKALPWKSVGSWRKQHAQANGPKLLSNRRKPMFWSAASSLPSRKASCTAQPPP